MQEEKPNQKEKVHIPYVQVRKYIPENVKYEDTRDYIIQALEFYQKYRTKVPTQTINNKEWSVKKGFLAEGCVGA